jgi:hypothetical protein
MAGASQLLCIKDFEEKAEQNLPDGLLQYYKSGAGHGHSLRFCQEAFLRYNKNKIGSSFINFTS